MPTEVHGSATPAAIELRGVVRTFGGTRALDGLDLRVPTGAVLGLLGNNGAGKTTTIRILMGLLGPHGGEVRVLGLDPTRQRLAVLRAVGLQSENDDPYDWMRLSEFFAVGRSAFPTWDAATCRELCERFELDRRKRVKELSKGMLAKAKLVFALSHGPRLLVLDEPTSGLDPGSQRELLDLIRRLSRERGITTLFSSHNLADVSEIATDVAIIHRGRVVFEEAMRTIRERYGLLRGPAERLEVWRAALDGQAVAADIDDGRSTLLVRDREGAAAALAEPGVATLEPAPLSELFHLLTTGRPAAARPIAASA